MSATPSEWLGRRFEDLVNVEVTTIEAVGITGRDMPAAPKAAREVARAYARFLRGVAVASEGPDADAGRGPGRAPEGARATGHAALYGHGLESLAAPAAAVPGPGAARLDRLMLRISARRQEQEAQWRKENRAAQDLPEAERRAASGPDSGPGAAPGDDARGGDGGVPAWGPGAGGLEGLPVPGPAPAAPTGTGSKAGGFLSRMMARGGRAEREKAREERRARKAEEAAMRERAAAAARAARKQAEARAAWDAKVLRGGEALALIADPDWPEVGPDWPVGPASRAVFATLRDAAWLHLAALSEDEKRSAGPEANRDAGLLYRILRNSGRMQDLLADWDPKSGDFAAPRQRIEFRKIWEIGAERIAMQTVLQLDGDVVTRIAPGGDARLFEAHQRGVNLAFGYWKMVLTLLQNFATGGGGDR